MENFEQTIISQYSTAPTIGRLISNMNDYIDPSVNIDSFYDLVWNVDTAVGWGLDVWGRIVGVGRIITIAADDFFGFEEASFSGNPFNQARYYSGGATTTNYALTDDGFRTLIFAKALANICDGSIAAINQLLLTLFPDRGNCYVVDNLDMTIEYTFEFPLSAVEISIVENSGVMPTPTGVSFSVVII